MNSLPSLPVTLLMAIGLHCTPFEAYTAKMLAMVSGDTFTEPIIMDGVYTGVLSMVSPVAASWYPSSVAVSATLHSLRMAPMEAWVVLCDRTRPRNGLSGFTVPAPMAFDTFHESAPPL